jgi:hypothetical protein
VIVLWTAVVEVCLAAVLLYWSRSAAAARRMTFGRAGSIAVLAAGMLLTAANALLALTSAERSEALFWTVAFPLFLVASAAVPLAAGSLFSPTNATDVGAGVLLAVATAGMFVVAWQIFV